MAQDDSTERWRPVPGWEGLYEVSDHGSIRRVSRLRPTITRKGYKVVTLTDRGRERWSPVHALVMEAFGGPRPEHYQIDHVNGVKTDNRFANLEYVTAAINTRRAYAHGAIVAPRGEAHGGAVLTEAQAQTIIERYSRGDISQDALAKELGVTRGALAGVSSGQTWKHLPRPGPPIHRWRNKLTAADRDAITQRYAAGEAQTRLARAFGVTQATVWNVLHRPRPEPAPPRARRSAVRRRGA